MLTFSLDIQLLWEVISIYQLKNDYKVSNSLLNW